MISVGSLHQLLKFQLFLLSPPHHFLAGSVIGRRVSPLCDLILQQRLTVLQRQTGQLQEVNPATLRPDAEEVARPQQQENRDPGRAVKQEEGGWTDQRLLSSRHRAQQTQPPMDEI